MSFSNGDIISEAKSDSEWINLAEKRVPAWCYYNNENSNSNNFGKLYNWYAFIDNRGLAPIGWRVPSLADWEGLSHELCQTSILDFYKLPGGKRCRNGHFQDINEIGYWWAAESDYFQPCRLYKLLYKSQNISRYSSSENYMRVDSEGLSVLCLRD